MQRLGADLNQLEGANRSLHQALESTQRVTAEAVKELQKLNVDARSALDRVSTIEKSIGDKLIADLALADDRERRSTKVRYIVGAVGAMLGATAIISKGWLDAVFSVLKIFQGGR